MCSPESCEWTVRYLPRRCWRVRLIHLLPSPLLDYPFSTTLALLSAVYGPTALSGAPVGAIQFMPEPYGTIWGGLMCLGSVIIWAALIRGRVGTWLPTGLWMCSLCLMAYVVLVLSTLNLGDYMARTVFSAIVGVVGVAQAFKLQTGHMWAVAAIRQAAGGGT